MPLRLPHTLTVTIDDRENIPYRFPESVTISNSSSTVTAAVQTRSATIRTADYRLDLFSNVCLVERKYSTSELRNNLEESYVRSMAALDRLANECMYPILTFDMSPSEMFRSDKYCPDPDNIVDRYLIECFKRGIHVLFLNGGTSDGSRRNAGKFLLHYILVRAMKEMK